MSEKSIHITFRASEEDVERMKELEKLRKVKRAELLRGLIDEEYQKVFNPVMNDKYRDEILRKAGLAFLETMELYTKEGQIYG